MVLVLIVQYGTISYCMAQYSKVDKLALILSTPKNGNIDYLEMSFGKGIALMFVQYSKVHSSMAKCKSLESKL